MAKPPPLNMQPPSPKFGEYCKQLADKKKLILCHASDSRELKFHSELKPILETHGFVCLSDPDEDANSAWVEYRFATAQVSSTMPKPSLPGNRIDGLHIFTYRAFLDSVNHYLHMDNISNLFTVRGIPVQRPPDARFVWRLAEVDNESFVYRANTLNQQVFNFYDRQQQGSNDSSSSGTLSGEVSIFNSIHDTDIRMQSEDSYDRQAGLNGSGSSPTESAEVSIFSPIHSTDIDTTSSIPMSSEDPAVKQKQD